MYCEEGLVSRALDQPTSAGATNQPTRRPVGAQTWPMRPSGASLALKPSRFSSSREAGFSGVQICTTAACFGWTGHS